MNKFTRTVLIITAVLLLATLCLCIVGCDTNNPTYAMDIQRYVGKYDLSKPHQWFDSGRLINLFVYDATNPISDLSSTTSRYVLGITGLAELSTDGYSSYLSAFDDTPKHTQKPIDPAIINTFEEIIAFWGRHIELKKDALILCDSNTRLDIAYYYIRYEYDFQKSIPIFTIIFDQEKYAKVEIFSAITAEQYDNINPQHAINLSVVTPVTGQDGNEYWCIVQICELVKA